MKKLIFKDVHFVKSCSLPKQCPCVKDDQGVVFPEIGVAGRSNVGKSSLLNHLFQSQNMVKTSQKPGKTRLLNFFQVDKACLFCDLPGYGYARVSEKMKLHWGKMIESYILNRQSLQLVLLLLDIRRDPSEQDMQFFKWVEYQKMPLLFVLTKADKVTKNEHARQKAKIIKLFDRPKDDFISYSVTKNIGRKELIFEINRRLYGSIDEQ